MHRALAWLALVAIGGVLNGCDCAYGGPGCGLPGLEGLCEARLQVGQSVVVTAVYGDDTGYHPAVVRSAETMNPSVLGVAQTANKGEVSLTANASGQTGLQLKVDGWGDQVFAWSFSIQDQVQPISECPDALIPDPAE